MYVGQVFTHILYTTINILKIQLFIATAFTPTLLYTVCPQTPTNFFVGEFGTGGTSANPQRGPMIVINMAAPGGSSVLFVCLGKKKYKISPDLL